MRYVSSNAIDSAAIHDNYIAPLFSLPLKLPPTAWHGHIPFLFVLFRNLKPARYVDLGVHLGASLIAAATAAQTSGLRTELYGVDTWQGDVHAGAYDGDTMHSDLKAFFNENFADVTLLRSTFDQARISFDERPVDLLHIDGLHTYEAVKHDYENWLPAMSERGVVLFHDTVVRERGFGVWRLWDELRQKFPSLEFTHSHGLGVLFVGRDSLQDAYMRRLVENSPLFHTYRRTIMEIAALLPIRSIHHDLEVEIKSLIAHSIDPEQIILLYKRRMMSIQEPFSSLLKPLREAPRGFLARLISR